METDFLASFSRPQREAIESAGYRVWRWAIAREVLKARVSKGRILNELGEFLKTWLPPVVPSVEVDELSLEFSVAPGQLHLIGGDEPIVGSPVERALLHLPALRSFWSRELRLQHFNALQAMVPKAWMLDDATIPPGAVIHGLGLSSWEQSLLVYGSDWEIQDQQGRVQDDKLLALASRNSVLIADSPPGTKLNAKYARNVRHRVVLRSLEASSS
ncbi:hypothetical protein [Prosthecobacter sp.]|uniref:hypothetical protein n=1 Tax=Prosthecobacter sp. TaxID=1965333 RepID=UPI001DC67BDC|nr:hypothetical protein [Prosthecobacter sp.]MCB1277394.1 hypothetical protein [Prosthecobacter sp.]